MKKYSNLSQEKIKELEIALIQHADDFYVEMYGRKEDTDVNKLRLYNRQGRILDKLQHDVMTGYYRRLGLWTDGITTLKEREKYLLLKKAEFGKKIAKVRDNTMADIDVIIKRAKEKRDKISKIPIALKEKYKLDKNAILNELQNDLQSFYERVENNIEIEVNVIYEDFIKNVKARQDSLITDARTKIINLQKEQKIRIVNEVENFSSELEAELTVLEYKEDDDDLIKQFNDEIKKINQELHSINTPIAKPKIPKKSKKQKEKEKEKIDEIIPEVKVKKVISEARVKKISEVKKGIINPDHPLKQLTMKELREMADKSGVLYENPIKKNQLITLIDAS